MNVSRYRFSILIVCAGLFILSVSHTRVFDALWTEDIEKNYAVYSLPLPEYVEFANRRIVLNDEELKERFDKELLTNTYWQSQTILFIKRGAKLFPVIEPILKSNGIPDDFKYLCVAESGLQAQVVSSSGAAGYWQFLEKTAKAYGLRISDEIDERYHLQKSTQAACQYLKEAYAKFGDWSLVAASYNMGMDGLSKQMALQKTSDYYNMHLNTETSRYLMRILAIKTIMEKPDMYGFRIAEKHLYKQTPTVKVKINGAIPDLNEFAWTYGCSYKDVRYYNPWIRKQTVALPGTWYVELPLIKVASKWPVSQDTIEYALK